MNDTTRALECLSPAQVESYRRNGYLVLEGRVPLDLIAQCHAEIDRIRNEARQLTAHTDEIDLEDSHTPDNPRIRRIKLPHKQSRVFDGLMRSDYILAPVRDLIGPNLRLQTSKLNMKSARYGAPVDWHQDWAFYPYTNDDILAVGVFLDDVDEENGPLMVFPGTHRGPAHDHHSGGYFAGTMSLAAAGLDPQGRGPRHGAGGVDLHPPCAHRPRLGPQPLGARPRCAVLRDRGGRCVPDRGVDGDVPLACRVRCAVALRGGHYSAARDQRARAHPSATAADARLDLRDPETERGEGLRARPAEGDVTPRPEKGPERDAPGLPEG